MCWIIQVHLLLCSFLDAPQISNSSSFTLGDVMVCSCEAHGNPSPKVEWHLSGHSVRNSTNTFISEERLSSTYLMSIITLHPSLTDTLLCVGTNSHGTTSQQFRLSPRETECKLRASFSLSGYICSYTVFEYIFAWDRHDFVPLIIWGNCSLSI